MFRSAALKLTVWYLAIIMILSVGLSLVIYRLSRDELVNNTRRQVYFFNDELNRTDFTTFARLRQRQLDAGLDRLRGDLLLFNLFVLTAGGVGSYGLARRTLRPLEDSLDAQKRFAADASHELRTPLTAMQAEIEVALKDKTLSQQAATRLLRSNLEEVGKLKDLSEGLLKLAAEEGKQTLKQVVSLKEITTEARAKLEKVALKKKVVISSRLHDVKVRGDRQSLIDLLSTLIDNAIKYSPPGAKITINVSRRDKLALVSITDKGPGIAKSELPRIFERFYRTDASRSRAETGGYGLGLAIAKKIADIHHGSIEVRSAPGKGSTFTLKLPSI